MKIGMKCKMQIMETKKLYHKNNMQVKREFKKFESKYEIKKYQTCL